MIKDEFEHIKLIPNGQLSGYIESFIAEELSETKMTDLYNFLYCLLSNLFYHVHSNKLDNKI